MSTLLNTGFDEHDDAQWLPLFGLITASLIVFLLISLSLLPVSPQQISQRYDARSAVYDALLEELSGDLQRWNASLDRETLSVTFSNQPDELFKAPKNQLTAHFRQALTEFYPRYTAVLHSFGAVVEEVRIEGHTSSDWGEMPAGRAYFLNLELSQRRVRSVLTFLYAIADGDSGQDWIRSKVSAVGLSSAKPVLDQWGMEDAERSRRIAFRAVIDGAAGDGPGVTERSHES